MRAEGVVRGGRQASTPSQHEWHANPSLIGRPLAQEARAMIGGEDNEGVARMEVCQQLAHAHIDPLETSRKEVGEPSLLTILAS